ncbi:MAG: hypothetical protein E7001_01905 [Coriobacteriaceae bacterium]|nr:hypothetical protein [Coriobacteriaceae bacterium]
MAPFLISGGIAAAAVGALPPAAIDIALTLAVLAGVAGLAWHARAGVPYEPVDRGLIGRHRVRLALLRRCRSERPASLAPSPERTLPC